MMRLFYRWVGDGDWVPLYMGRVRSDWRAYRTFYMLIPFNWLAWLAWNCFWWLQRRLSWPPIDYVERLRREALDQGLQWAIESNLVHFSSEVLMAELIRRGYK